MVFNSWEFALFFPFVIFLFFAFPFRYRWIILLVASYVFYMAWRVEYILLLIFSTCIDYWASNQMSKKSTKNERKPYLYVSILSNLGLLFSFKYLDFFASSFNYVFPSTLQIPLMHLVLPMGISFYTFQTLSYSIDVYNGEIKAEKHLGIFAVFVSFFPQLVAGPIERASNLLPQFREKHFFDEKRIKLGLQLMAWGFFKKLVIADRVAIVVNQVYNSPSDFSGLSIWIASILFAFQIYCDFSGYSDIAIGAAQVMGYNLMKNFDRPYFSKSISEFWKRWHISLSSWFKDYVYIPLGGNRTVKWRWYYNLFITFLISGVWHGANWTFVIWGALHGFYLIAALQIQPISNWIYSKFSISKESLFYKFFHISITFFLVLVAWVFFRANNVSDAFLILEKSVEGNFLAQIKDLFLPFKETFIRFSTAYLKSDLTLQNQNLGIKFYEFLITLFGLFIMETVHFLQRNHSLREEISKLHWILRWGLYYAFIASIIFLGSFGEASTFIYFQF
ncbi:MBOAT family O-acyltransferase [Bernardetia sp.]|uniref:MBOAT family O-acyltransferase n=1 Tax=Bernardetia sp. TaxID=1937974 RepID=UPI0025C49C8F|nr:MBOAT family O-acyltransferase [Bernardetia sp.]